MSPLTESTRVVLKQPTGASWCITPMNLLPDDADAVAYIAAVEAADGEALEPAVRLAINSFVKGCKQDGIWPAIKASCILAGARTLSGALVPLRGTAPTNFNFVAGDYDRKTGLVGDGSTKRLSSGFSFASANLNNAHLSAYAASINTVLSTGVLVGANAGTEVRHVGSSQPTSMVYQANDSSSEVNVGTSSAGLYGWSRSSGTQKTYRYPSASVTVAQNSTGVQVTPVYVFARNNGTIYGAHRLAFYSIGEALDLALLDTRVTALVNALGTAIP